MIKRLIASLILAAATAVVAHGIYSELRPAPSVEQRAIGWLARELELTAEQQRAIFEIHQRRCAEMGRWLEEAAATGSPHPHRRHHAYGACRAATGALIEEVSAQLGPEQRARYLRLVEPCLMGPWAR